MKKSITVISLISVVVLSAVAACFLPIKVVALAICATVLAAAFFGGLFALMYVGAKKRAELRKNNPELAQQLDELELANEQMWNPYLG